MGAFEQIVFFVRLVHLHGGGGIDEHCLWVEGFDVGPVSFCVMELCAAADGVCLSACPETGRHESAILHYVDAFGKALGGVVHVLVVVV